MTATDIAALTREITVLTFDQYGTLVDMQTGLTEAVAPFLHAKGWPGELHRFVIWWRRTHYEDSMIDALCDRGHTPYSVWSGNYAMVIPKQQDAWSGCSITASSGSMSCSMRWKPSCALSTAWRR